MSDRATPIFTLRTMPVETSIHPVRAALRVKHSSSCTAQAAHQAALEGKRARSVLPTGAAQAARQAGLEDERARSSRIRTALLIRAQPTLHGSAMTRNLTPTSEH